MEEITTRRTGRTPIPLAIRFEMQVDKSGDCWLWTGVVSNGYGHITAEAPSKVKLKTHRVSFELANGPIPEGMQIDHMCRVRLCVNPSHLRLVTSKQNREHLAGPLSNNKCGYLGVRKASKNRWLGKVKHNNIEHYTARFDTAEEAAEAVRLLRLELFTHNDRDRRDL